MAQDHWLHGFNYNVEEWFEGDRYETLAICRQLAHARAVFKEAVAEKPAGPLHDAQPHPRRETAPGGRLVSPLPT
jgi:hypothetical protein